MNKKKNPIHSECEAIEKYVAHNQWHGITSVYMMRNSKQPVSHICLAQPNSIKEVK